MNTVEIDGLTEIYSLIVCIDHIEKAFERDSISPDEYNTRIYRLMAQYAKLVQDPQIQPVFKSLDQFVSEYDVQASSGINRLRVGIPATAEAIDTMTDTKVTSTGSAKAVAEVAGNFITFCDGIHIGYRDKNDLHPLLAELTVSLNNVTKASFDGRGKIVEWLIKLNQLQKSQKITDEEASECLKDVEKGYHAFLAILDWEKQTK